jgi:hypothetical protein
MTPQYILYATLGGIFILPHPGIFNASLL